MDFLTVITELRHQSERLYREWEEKSMDYAYDPEAGEDMERARQSFRTHEARYHEAIRCARTIDAGRENCDPAQWDEAMYTFNTLARYVKEAQAERNSLVIL